MTPHFEWLRDIKYEGNLLLFINTHSDTESGNLVVSRNEGNPMTLPITELLDNYIDEQNLKPGVGPCIHGLVICSCGSTRRVMESAQLLKCMVERDIFDFMLAFTGISTMDAVVVPALNRSIENVYIYNIKIWDALEESFWEDRHTLNHLPVVLSFADIQNDINKKRTRVVDTRVLAFSNLKDGRPWGLDIF
ncbi:uncharacterized protein F5147DRAFT_780287 [Suillus discolor]|uniref:Uncharacterized protein n=1 Tax=Suillus discolor TaxID=1912936 RepID=A0A9P7EVG8_9AGAM|nr:uncharacterized protein F5147DRAFT_780287 [Suillus discolor]KAG2090479.1 hypothetical protein F5147DRAFT_780287 [Suillus discolor]